MKKRLPKILLGGVVLFLVLNLVLGFKLAQPERTGRDGVMGGDPFIGFHLVPERIVRDTLPDGSEIGYVEGSEDRTHWVEYGSEMVKLEGFGNVAFPREILIGTYNKDTRRFDFPGMEGYNCFLAITQDEDGGNYITGYTDMTETHLERKVTDEGEENILTTALYAEPRSAEEEGSSSHWVLTAYRVYQMEDGTVYLDGTGNSFGGAGFTITEKSKFTTDLNGQKTTEIMSVEFSLKDANRMEEVAVIWFGEDDTPIETDIFDPAELEEELELTAPQGAAWAMVRETDERGSVTRTPMNLDYNGHASHKLILLDERGIGRACWLRWNQTGQTA